jgi:hypothetical protein
MDIVHGVSGATTGRASRRRLSRLLTNSLALRGSDPATFQYPLNLRSPCPKCGTLTRGLRKRDSGSTAPASVALKSGALGFTFILGVIASSFLR